MPTRSITIRRWTRYLISAPNLDEFWIVDHHTTTEEARGPAGDLLYRWGNPRAYGRGGPEDRQIGFQHDVQWIPPGYPGAGNILMYSNRQQFTPAGADEPVDYSRVVEITPPLQADGRYTLDAGAGLWSRRAAHGAMTVCRIIPSSRATSPVCSGSPMAIPW